MTVKAWLLAALGVSLIALATACSDSTGPTVDPTFTPAFNNQDLEVSVGAVYGNIVSFYGPKGVDPDMSAVSDNPLLKVTHWALTKSDVGSTSSKNLWVLEVDFSALAPVTKARITVLNGGTATLMSFTVTASGPYGKG